ASRAALRRAAQSDTRCVGPAVYDNRGGSLGAVRPRLQRSRVCVALQSLPGHCHGACSLPCDPTCAPLRHVEMHTSSGFTIFHLSLAGAAKARPGNGFQTLNFDRIFTACANAIVVAVDALNSIFNRP